MRGHESFEVAGMTAQLDFLRGLRWACVHDDKHLVLLVSLRPLLLAYVRRARTAHQLPRRDGHTRATVWERLC